MFCLAERTPQKRRGDGAGDEEILGVRLLRKGNREIFGVAELMMGANHIRLRCIDGVTRLGRIKGKIKKKVWIREGISSSSFPGRSRTRGAISSTGTPAPRSGG